jgi:hypothetical protein
MSSDSHRTHPHHLWQLRPDQLSFQLVSILWMKEDNSGCSPLPSSYFTLRETTGYVRSNLSLCHPHLPLSHKNASIINDPQNSSGQLDMTSKPTNAHKCIILSHTFVHLLVIMHIVCLLHVSATRACDIAIRVAAAWGRYTMCIIYFHTLTCIRWFWCHKSFN